MNRSATTESTIIPNIHHDNIKTVNQYEDDYRRQVIISCDNFSGKILPVGLEIFPANRRLDLAFPANPGVTFAAERE